MSTLLPAACALLAVVSAAAVLLRTHDLRLGVRVLLDFLVAAGLLRLTGEPAWRDVVAAAALVLVRVVLR